MQKNFIGFWKLLNVHISNSSRFNLHSFLFLSLKENSHPEDHNLKKNKVTLVEEKGTSRDTKEGTNHVIIDS